MNLSLQTIKEWKDLGFYYEYEEDLKQWRFYGSKDGLMHFVNRLINYATDTSNINISEHIHLGPYNYLKLMTWHKASISKEYIAGTLPELAMLSDLIREKLSRSSIGETFRIGKDYSADSKDIILFFVMADNFDPSIIEFGD